MDFDLGFFASLALPQTGCVELRPTSNYTDELRKHIRQPWCHLELAANHAASLAATS